MRCGRPGAAVGIKQIHRFGNKQARALTRGFRSFVFTLTGHTHPRLQGMTLRRFLNYYNCFLRTAFGST